MKISEIELINSSKYLFVKVHTDQGITGIGEVGVWGFIDAATEVIKKFESYLIGNDPLKIEHHWQYMYRSMYFRGAIVLSAISAIDIALWDIAGKYMNVPTYQLLGGKTRDKVRTYVPIHSVTPDEMAKDCLIAKQNGYTAARLMVSERESSRSEEVFSYKIKQAVEKVKACREAVGDEFDLCVEIHRSMSPAEAITFAREIEKYNPYFIEDPIAPDNPEVMSYVANKTHIPIATGERAINIHEFETLVSQRGAMYVRPDVCTIGGLTSSKKVATIAEAHYVGVVPHNPLGPVSTAACIHLAASIPNFSIQELSYFNLEGKEDGMVKDPLIIEDGYIIVPDQPGIGVELADDVAEKFPPNQRDLKVKIGYDGSVKDR